MSAASLHSHRAHRRHCRGFTLLEMTLAIILSSFVITAIFMFVRANVDAVETMMVEQQAQARSNGLESLLKGSLARGAAAGEIKLEGANHQIGALPSDELSFDAESGNPVLSDASAGTYRVKLRLKEDQRVSYLGLERQPIGEGIVGPSSWVPLMSEVNGLDFQFFDSRQNTWIDEWKQPGNLPRLIRTRIWTENGQEEIMIFIPPKGVAW